jgi:Flp pilus assembly protein TadB
MFIFFRFVVFATLVWFLCPRLFLRMDQRVASSHVSQLVSQPHQLFSSPISSTSRSFRIRRSRRQHSPPKNLPEYARCLDSLARATRSHQPTRNALAAALSLLTPTDALTKAIDDLHSGREMEISLSPSECQSHEQQLFEFLRISLVHQVFVPQALEQAADIIQEEFRHHQDVTTATAQARSSASLLTLVPFAVLALLLLSSSTARQGSLTAPFVLTIAVGVVVNRIGWWWIQQLVNSSGIATTDLSLSLAQRLCISLRAGVPLRLAIEEWAAEHDPTLNETLLGGDSLSTSLHDFVQRQAGGSHHLAQVLLEADRDGLPIVHTVSRLSAEMRTHRRHQADIKTRQLPTKLTLPVVLCVLPSFVFLAVIPLILANLSQFTFSPPPIPPIS